MSNVGFVTLAYGLAWAVLIGYALYLGARTRRAERAARAAFAPAGRER